MKKTKTIKTYCPSCKGGSHLVRSSKTGKIIRCKTCNGTGVIIKIVKT